MTDSDLLNIAADTKCLQEVDNLQPTRADSDFPGYDLATLINAPKIKCVCGMIAKGLTLITNNNHGVKIGDKWWHYRKCPGCGRHNLLGEHIPVKSIRKKK